jgi:hypothetical protein
MFGSRFGFIILALFETGLAGDSRRWAACLEGLNVQGDPAMKSLGNEVKWPSVQVVLSLLFVLALLGSGVFVFGYYLR